MWVIVQKLNFQKKMCFSFIQQITLSYKFENLTVLLNIVQKSNWFTDMFACDSSRLLVTLQAKTEPGSYVEHRSCWWWWCPAVCVFGHHVHDLICRGCHAPPTPFLYLPSVSSLSTVLQSLISIQWFMPSLCMRQLG